jgi:hypothetical protein
LQLYPKSTNLPEAFENCRRMRYLLLDFYLFFSSSSFLDLHRFLLKNRGACALSVIERIVPGNFLANKKKLNYLWFLKPFGKFKSLPFGK